MPEAITNTSPLLYLHRTGKLSWLRELFSAILVPSAVVGRLLVSDAPPSPKNITAVLSMRSPRRVSRVSRPG
jgi:hypothetical protein